jgi:DNA mismatch repair protein MSH6
VILEIDVEDEKDMVKSKSEQGQGKNSINNTNLNKNNKSRQSEANTAIKNSNSKNTASNNVFTNFFDLTGNTKTKSPAVNNNISNNKSNISSNINTENKPTRATKKANKMIIDDSDEEVIDLEKTSKIKDDDYFDKYNDKDDDSSESFSTPTNKKKKSIATNNNSVSNNKSNNRNSVNMSPNNSSNNIQVVDAFANPCNGLPEFLKADKIRDKMGRRPDDPNYDPTTLLVPASFIKSKECTPVMKQYWTFKIDHFDKVLLFKLGKFYEMFFDDAIIGNAVLDLNWMGNDPKKLHVGFPEKCLEEKASKLVEAGFKVSVVEQTEKPEELKERNKESGMKDKVVKRELCNVFTKGTYFNTNNNSNNVFSYTNKYCITITCNLNSMSNHHISQVSKEKSAVINLDDDNQNVSQSSNNQQNGFSQLNSQQSVSTSYSWGYIIFDVTTLKFFIGQFTEDDESFTKIMTLLYNVRPEEVILMRNNIPSYIVNFISTISSKPQVTYLKNDYNVLSLNKICTKYFGENIDNWQKTILDYVSQEDTHRNACCALYITANYLEKILLAEQCLSIGVFEEYEYHQIATGRGDAKFNSKTMIIDYQAVSNLELIETKINPKNPEEGSLLEYMNRAVSGFGKRLMKNWLLNPLYNVEDINERLDIIEDFIKNSELLSNFRNALMKWPDIERQTSKIYKFAISNNSKAVYFEDVSKTRLQEFFSLINFLKKSMDIFKLFEPYIEKLRSAKLIQKVTIKDQEDSSLQNQNGIVPNIKDELEHFSENFIIRYEKDENNNQTMIVEPTEGIWDDYDQCKNEISEIEAELDGVLKREKKRLKCPIITYAHTKFYKYELEIPEEYVTGDKRPAEYKLTTSKKGFLRFHTKEIISLVERLDICLERLKDETKKFNVVLFKQFYMKSGIINEYIKNIAELDCLAALATVSSQSEGEMVRPEFISIENNHGLPYLHFEKSRHPCLSSRTHGFVSNDILIGNNFKTAIVITGPNMGGKSTLLRQTCVITIMAQLGCYVPAEKCVMTPVDRIFTRIGARDKILEGKSTFYIEMEETKSIMSNATINSLIIMDELGRGTSTHDGNIIAKTILDRLEKKLQARTLFTTHYHSLKDWCANQPGVDLYFMDCLVNEKSKDITFLYKFKQGICPQSYGIHVAKLAGLPVRKKNTKILKNKFTMYFRNLLFKWQVKSQRCTEIINPSCRPINLF